MSFKVEFAEGDVKQYPDSVRFTVENNGVLTISDGGDVIHYAPHRWNQVWAQQDSGEMW
jgi:flagellar basal body rod protein FlgG